MRADDDAGLRWDKAVALKKDSTQARIYCATQAYSPFGMAHLLNFGGEMEEVMEPLSPGRRSVDEYRRGSLPTECKYKYWSRSKLHNEIQLSSLRWSSLLDICEG